MGTLEGRRSPIGGLAPRPPACVSLLLPVLAATAALVAAGCSVSIGDKTIDAGSVEDQIAQNLESQGERGRRASNAPATRRPSRAPRSSAS